jgi:hypothetical protein
MARHHTSLTRNRISIFEGAIVACALVAPRILGGFQSTFCPLLDQPPWLSLEILRTLFTLLDVLPVLTFIFGESCLVQHLLQLSATLSPLFCFISC